ncbi:MAG: hypothetical protein AAFP78_01975, partial [Pseudomonadota bacterium]
MKKLLCSALLLCGLASPSAAATITFDDRSTFLAAAGSVTTHANPTFSQIRTPDTVSFNGLTLAPAPGSSVLSSNTFSTLIANEIAQSGVENFDVTVNQPSPVFGFGFDVHEPIASTGTRDGCNVSVCLESTFQVSLLLNGALLQVVQFSPANDVLAFFGVQTTDPFNQIQVREIVGGNDNEFFGNFVSTQVAA